MCSIAVTAADKLSLWVALICKYNHVCNFLFNIVIWNHCNNRHIYRVPYMPTEGYSNSYSCCYETSRILSKGNEIIPIEFTRWQHVVSCAVGHESNVVG